MMKRIFVFVMAIMMSLSTMIAQNAILPCGGDAAGSGGSASYSVGQVVYQFKKNSETSVSEGVQQPFEIFVSGIDEHAEISLNAIVFPNPTINSVELKIETESITVAYDVFLYDVTGRLLKTLKVAEKQTLIEMETFAPGTYFLKILENRELLKTFKIIKS